MPWSVTLEINSINRLRDLLTVRVQYFLRKENALADYFANLVFDFAGTYEYKTFQEVPSKGKRLINLDKQRTQNLRIR